MIEDLEIITHFQREDFKIRPEDDGAKILGDVTITEINRKGQPMRINCRNDVGDTGYNIPYNVEEEKIKFEEFGNSKCIMAIETGGMFDRLVENGFDETHDVILVHINLGVTPSDILNYELPADELTDRDKSALKSILTDPRFKSKYWRSEIELQLEINRKSEQQALAKYGLDFVTNTYLPEKLKEMNIT